MKFFYFLDKNGAHKNKAWVKAAVMDGDNLQVGVVEVELMMADGGEVAEVASSPVQPSPARTTQSSLPHSASLDELRAKALRDIQEMKAKAALEIEDWKRNQKKKFKEEVSCIQTAYFFVHNLKTESRFLGLKTQ